MKWAALGNSDRLHLDTFSETTLTHTKDLELVRRCIARDDKAVREVGKRLAAIPRMVRLVNARHRRTLSPEAEADAAQEVFVQIWDRLATFEGRSTLEGWAWAFAENHTRNRVRKVVSERYRRDERPKALEHEAMVSDDSLPRISRRTAESWLEGLSPAMAQCIRMKHFEGLRFREIAEELGVSENTIKARYYRGLKQLRQALSDKPGAPNFHE